MNYILKVILVGDFSVGKTSILTRYIDQKEVRHDSTLGVDFRCKIINYEGNNYKLHIWDTAGQEKFKSIVLSYFRGIDVVLYIYDVTNVKSFNNIKKWDEDIDLLCQSNNNEDTNDKKNIVKYLIANKIDSKLRVIEYKNGYQYAKKNNMNYFETSVKEQELIDNVFENLVKDVNLKIIKKEMNPRIYSDNDIKIKSKYKNKINKKSKNTCCIIS